METATYPSEIVESIAQLIPEGNRLELPVNILENYGKLKKALIAAGGKYKRCGFEFSEDAASVQARLLSGEVVDDRKKFQFFATPTSVARRMLEFVDLDPGYRVLEPSAGQGAIADVIRESNVEPVVVELMPANAKALRRKGYTTLETDFLDLSPTDTGLFDVVVANPPFTRNQDIEHVRHMYDFLRPGGTLVSITSPSWTFGEISKQESFRRWLATTNYTIEHLPEGAFKESGTMIRTVLIVIRKR